MTEKRGYRKCVPWSPEEDALLECVYRSPNLYRLWGKLAAKNNWPPRSLKALRSRISHLQESRRYGDEASGWLTAAQLLKCLGLYYNNADRIHRWEQMGLRTYRDNDRSDLATSPIKIHMADFVKWVLGNGEEVSHAIRGEQLAVAWLLRQIADWKDEKNQAANWMRPSPGQRTQRRAG